MFFDKKKRKWKSAFDSSECYFSVILADQNVYSPPPHPEKNWNDATVFGNSK